MWSPNEKCGSPAFGILTVLVLGCDSYIIVVIFRQLLGDFDPTSTGALPVDPTRDFCPPTLSFVESKKSSNYTMIKRVAPTVIVMVI